MADQEEVPRKKVEATPPQVVDESPMQFPVYLYEDGVELPKKGTYFVVAQNGTFVHKENAITSALVRVERIGFLRRVETEIELKLPKVPARIIGQALWFFRKIYDLHRSEVGLLLLYSSKRKQYMLWCPKQHVTPGSVNYDRDDQPELKERQTEGWHMIGTIHSHCDFSAFHSGTDTHDEESFDGIHITIGHVRHRLFSIVSSVAVNANRVQMEPESSCIGVERRIDKEEKENRWMTWSRDDAYDLVLNEADTQGLVDDIRVMTESWLPKVTHGWKEGGFGASFFQQETPQVQGKAPPQEKALESTRGGTFSGVPVDTGCSESDRPVKRAASYYDLDSEDAVSLDEVD